MFEHFEKLYAHLADAAGPAGSPWIPTSVARVEAYADFARRYAGVSFDSGLYRVHDAPSGWSAQILVADTFPGLDGRAVPFAYDWSGRQLVLDSGRTDGDEPRVSIVDVGTGDVLETPVGFREFHEVELTDFPDEALSAEVFDAWRDAYPGAEALGREECLGWTIPLFLGGSDSVDNLARTDLEVYWEMTSQLRLGIAHLP